MTTFSKHTLISGRSLKVLGFSEQDILLFNVQIEYNTQQFPFLTILALNILVDYTKMR